jgi:hypothetical protein
MKKNDVMAKGTPEHQTCQFIYNPKEELDSISYISPLNPVIFKSKMFIMIVHSKKQKRFMMRAFHHPSSFF